MQYVPWGWLLRPPRVRVSSRRPWAAALQRGLRFIPEGVGGHLSSPAPCRVEFVLARASEKSNSHAAEKYKIKGAWHGPLWGSAPCCAFQCRRAAAPLPPLDSSQPALHPPPPPLHAARKRPQEIFSLGMPCPNGAFMIGKDEGHGRQTVGSQGYKGAKAATGACPGFTTGAQRAGRCKPPPGLSGAPHGLQTTDCCRPTTLLCLPAPPSAAAELVKPAKAPPAPPPPEAAPAPRGPKKAKPSAPAGGQAKRGGTPASSASSSSTHLPARAPSGAGIRLVGEKHAGWSTVGQPKGAGAAARIFGSKGPPAGGGGGGVPGTARSTNGGGGSGLSFPTGMRPLALQVGAVLACGCAWVCGSRCLAGGWQAHADAACTLHRGGPLQPRRALLFIIRASTS